ncbi:type II CAAX prenyl endopeptidase Rce1 family protein [Streptomyces kanamyceticus]|uniref:CPBP family intramembrane metalloprotease n=1 Tax=Streptomyces kanamyceticus TaxID=1967 RepID=A0A5J6GJ08_STRKN|nr:CPBP family glutamic-type intramembrane protease [Streptomyces kanamyceticus]QEU93915.1 CPBP family intramembrane metalloprotease [Streptomyces kanamyceticus]
MSTPLRVLVLVAVVLLYYWLGKAVLFRAVRHLAAVTRIGPARWGTAQRADVFELAAAGASHVVVVAALLAITGIGPGMLVSGLARPELLGLGVLLGIGELAIGSLICRALIEVRLAGGARRRVPASPVNSARTTGGSGLQTRTSTPVRVRPREDHGLSLRSWLGRSRGGWIRHHLTALKVLPLWAALGLTGVQVASEELVFRGIALTWLRDAGPGVALTTSIVLFVVMQAFFMSTWQGAMFPLMGGVVMGVVHGLVFWAVPDVAPLVVAHVVFFVFAVI